MSGMFPEGVWKGLFPPGVWPEFAGMGLVSDPEIINVRPGYQIRYGTIPRARLIVYREMDNAEQYVLRSCGRTIDVADLSRVRIVCPAGIIDSDESPPSFDFAQKVTPAEAARNTSLIEGESKLVLSLGPAAFPEGKYLAPIVVYDSAHPRGVFVGLFDLLIVNLAALSSP